LSNRVRCVWTLKLSNKKISSDWEPVPGPKIKEEISKETATNGFEPSLEKGKIWENEMVNIKTDYLE
jgi:hypothetical protein